MVMQWTWKKASLLLVCLEVHTNGLLGFHFTHFEDEKEYAGQVDKVAKFLVTQGVTGL